MPLQLRLQPLVLSTKNTDSRRCIAYGLVVRIRDRAESRLKRQEYQAH
jgi:hypothetical protein